MDATLDVSRISMFLEHAVGAANLVGVQCFVFGSVARGDPNPRDVDILLVYQPIDHERAAVARKLIRGNSEEFERTFRRPLNLLVISSKEMEEAKDAIGPLVSLL